MIDISFVVLRDIISIPVQLVLHHPPPARLHISTSTQVCVQVHCALLLLCHPCTGSESSSLQYSEKIEDVSNSYFSLLCGCTCIQVYIRVYSAICLRQDVKGCIFDIKVFFV